MRLYPAIDLLDGRCVRLRQGDFAQVTAYSDDPVAMALSFEAAGASWIHVVDLDAARRTGSNRTVVERIAGAVSISVQAGGGVRDASLLESGVARVVVGSWAVEDPDSVAALANAHPGQVAVGLDHRQGKVQVHGWQEGAAVSVEDMIDRLPDAAAFIVTDVERDGTLVGPDVDGLSRLVQHTEVAVIASGGVGSLADLAGLAGAGVEGVIVGKALYEGRFSIDEAVAACGR